MIEWSDNSEGYCQELEEYDALVKRLENGNKLLDVPQEKRALAMGLWAARRGRKRKARRGRK